MDEVTELRCKLEKAERMLATAMDKKKKQRLAFKRTIDELRIRLEQTERVVELLGIRGGEDR